MRKRVVAGLFLIAPVLLGQLDSNSVTVTASSTANLQPDQVVFSVQVVSGLSANLNDIVAALQGSGITVANFTTIDQIPQGFSVIRNGLPSSQPTIAWDFTLAAPLAKIKDTVAQLTSLQQSIAAQKNGLSMSFSVQGAQVSQQLQQSQPCVISDLLANARAQAQNLATAAGFTLDAILAMSSTVSTTISNQAATLSSFVLGASTSPCTVTVKFAVVRNQ
jgi:uncharacterized protein YggE